MKGKIIRKFFIPALIIPFIVGLMACTSGEEAARKKLQELDYEFSGQGFTRAVTRKDKLATKLFFEAKIDPQAKNSVSIPIIMIAANAGDEDAVTELLSRGANIHEKADVGDYKGVSLLHIAAMGGDPKIIEKLLSKGLDVNVYDDQGLNPLWYAAAVFYREDAVRLLMKRGAIATHPDHFMNFGQSQILDFYRRRALSEGKTGIADLISERMKGVRDCASVNAIPDKELEAVQACEAACNGGRAFACGVAGRILVRAGAKSGGSQGPISDAIRALALFEKGCELKDFSVCSETGRNVSKVQLQNLKTDCDSGKAIACGRYASAWDRPSNAADKKLADQELGRYSDKGCKGGDVFSCLWLASYYVSQGNPDNLRDPMFQKAHPHYSKACQDGWSSGCDLMGK